MVATAFSIANSATSHRQLYFLLARTNGEKSARVPQLEKHSHARGRIGKRTGCPIGALAIYVICLFRLEGLDQLPLGQRAYLIFHQLEDAIGMAFRPRLAILESCDLSIAWLIPAVTYQRQQNNDAVEELDVEAGKAGGHHAGLDEGNDQRADGERYFLPILAARPGSKYGGFRQSAIRVT